MTFGFVALPCFQINHLNSPIWKYILGMVRWIQTCQLKFHGRGLHFGHVEEIFTKAATAYTHGHRILAPTKTGRWYTYPSEKYEFVSWDYYSQLNGKS
jgi:hypothetical protein